MHPSFHWHTLILPLVILAVFIVAAVIVDWIEDVMRLLDECENERHGGFY